MRRERDLFFVPRQDMTSVYELDAISDLSETAYWHFMNHEEEILYLLNGGKLHGVLSIGDLERFYKNDCSELKINEKYTYSGTVDYDMAAAFFERTVTINEIPIVAKQRELLGVIRKRKARGLRDLQRRKLKSWRILAWYRNELMRFISHTKAKVFLYYDEWSEVQQYLGENGMRILEERRDRERARKKNWKGLTEKEWTRFLGAGETEYDPRVVEIMRTELGNTAIVLRKGVMLYQDACKQSFYNIKEGCRITHGGMPDAARRIFMYGACTMIGGYCKDDQTIASYLQGYLNDNDHTDWRVLNKGKCGQVCFCSGMFTDALSENDIAVIWVPQQEWLSNDTMHKCVYQGNLTKVFLGISSLIDHILDDYRHCNYKVNQKLAEQIYKDICDSEILDSPMHPGIPERQQDYYIDWDVYMYFMDYFYQNGLHKENDCIRTGAFVMACDSFTQANRIWIKEALKCVDKLYLFIVEDPEMQFSLDDRIRIAKSGVEGLPGVTVVPAGKYIFPNKLSRSIRKGKPDQDAMEYDCDIWGEVVARQLGIKYRFVTDEVESDAMKEYNQVAKRVLPNFGIKVIEFPRENGEVGGAADGTVGYC